MGIILHCEMLFHRGDESSEATSEAHEKLPTINEGSWVDVWFLSASHCASRYKIGFVAIPLQMLWTQNIWQISCGGGDSKSWTSPNNSEISQIGPSSLSGWLFWWCVDPNSNFDWTRSNHPSNPSYWSSCHLTPFVMRQWSFLKIIFTSFSQ